jgi:Peptidase family M28
MTTEEILDTILIPRPNGSENLDTVASSLAESLANAGALVSEQYFTATAHGFQLVWIMAVIMMAAYGYCLLKGKYLAAALIPVVLAVLLVLEFEYLISTVSALSNTEERNIIGTFPGREGAPVLIFCAHYDTATHFGDHFSWGRWGKLQGPATGLAIGFPLLALWLRRKGKAIPLPVTCAVIPLAAAPFIAMFWFQSVGPLVRTPSLGAIDNGGSVAALLLLAQELGERPKQTGSTVEIVFLAAEEERTLGSWSYVKRFLAGNRSSGEGTPPHNVRVVNLESIGTTDEVAYISEDGFATRRFYSSQAMIDFVNRGAEVVYGKPLQARELPFGVLTDGRSFLAHGVEAITLRSFEGSEFPRDLHSEHDSRDRLSIKGIERTVTLLQELVQQVE